MAAQAATEKATEAAIAAEKKRSADRAARAVKRSRAEKYIEPRKLADEPAKQAAMADALRARAHKVDTVLWGVPLGSPLTLPDCDTVAEWHDEILFGTRITTKTTCMLFADDGAASVVWTQSAFPSWAHNVTSVVKNDVLVSVKITFMSAAAQTGNSLVGTGMRGLVNGVGNAIGQAGYEAASKEAEANVEGAHKYLRAKYGKPSRTSEAETKWDLHGLRVRYAADVYRDTVTIRLDSADE